MKTNIIILTINVPTESNLKIINNTFAFKKLFHSTLNVGDNVYSCNPYNYSQIERMQCSIFTIVSKQIKH